MQYMNALGSNTNLNDNLQPTIYLLKHKNADVAALVFNLVSGTIDKVLSIYDTKLLPVGCTTNIRSIQEWWGNRAIPNTREGIRSVLENLHLYTTTSLLLQSYGLSLVDHYWVVPITDSIKWDDINFYANSFSNDVGEQLFTDSDLKINICTSMLSPASSAVGEMKKKWLIIDDKRVLVKTCQSHYSQQCLNEVVATKLHEFLNYKNYTTYWLTKVTSICADEFSVCCNAFTSNELEFVSAHQLCLVSGQRQSESSFEQILRLAEEYGLDSNTVLEQLEYTIMTDFLLTNTDRHFNNFGFLRDETLKLVKMAPIFDTGNALFFNDDFVPKGKEILKIEVNSFCTREVRLLRYVKNKAIIDTSRLKGFGDVIWEIFNQAKMPAERIDQRVQAFDEKLKLLQIFQNGSKIWKDERYR